MDDADNRDESEDIGYGRPPKRSRFKPGQSGNPRGRPKGRVPFSRLVEKYLDARMNVTFAGKLKTVSRREALILGMIGDALQGKERVRKQLFDLLLLIEARAPIETGEIISRDDDAAIIDGFLKRLGHVPGRPPKAEPTATSDNLNATIKEGKQP